jgi:ribonuclease BN (tRNA processing enzyme)
VEIFTAGRTLVFDAGTGIIQLGHDLAKNTRQKNLHIFLSHTHHDHIEGLRFFGPAYDKQWNCHLYGRNGGTTMRRVLASAMTAHVFPVSLDELPGRITLRDLSSDDSVDLGGRPKVVVRAKHSDAHPKVGVLLYRVTCSGRSVVYSTDVEAARGGYEDVVEFARGADVLIHDAQYTEEEYFGKVNKAGWGHSTVRQAVETAKDAGVGQLVLYHHDPEHDDRHVAQLEREARKLFPATIAAREGLEISI